MIVPLALLGLVWLLPQDPFVAQRDAAAARNPRSPRFTIALAEGRRSFRPGERIPLVLSYDTLGRYWRRNQDVSYLRFADVVLDHTDGTAQPLADFVRAKFNVPGGGVCCGVPAGVVGPQRGFGRIVFGADGVPFFLEDPPPPPRPPPVTVNVFVNDGVRFDAPGHYRLHGGPPRGQQISENEPKPPPLVSNIVEFDITARDPEWEDQTAASALAIMDASPADPEWTTAARTLRFLGSERAVDEMANRLGRPHAPLEHDLEFIRGLFSARDRARAIARMEAALDDPNRPLSALYLGALAAIRMTPTPGARYSAAQRQAQQKAYEQRRSLALKRARR